MGRKNGLSYADVFMQEVEYDVIYWISMFIMSIQSLIAYKDIHYLYI